MSRDGSLVWVTAEEERVVLEVNTQSGQIERRWGTSGYRSHMVTATPDDRKLYVANLDDGTVSVIDRAAGTTSLIAAGGGPEGIDISPSGAEVWVTSRDDGTVAMIDTRTDDVVERFAAGWTTGRRAASKAREASGAPLKPRTHVRACRGTRSTRRSGSLCILRDGAWRDPRSR